MCRVDHFGLKIVKMCAEDNVKNDRLYKIAVDKTSLTLCNRIRHVDPSHFHVS